MTKQRQCVFSFPEGDVLVTFPEPMTLETVDTLDECLRLLFRGFRRRALAVQAEVDGEAEYVSWAPLCLPITGALNADA